jgi:hypothetical protein
MDLYCSSCGECWEKDHVLYKAPQDFQRSGLIIDSCPLCKQNKRREMPICFVMMWTVQPRS